MREQGRRVLCVHSGGPILRGSELVLLDFLTTMQRTDREVRLLCDQVALRDQARKLGISAALVPRGEFMLDKRNLQLDVIGLLRSNWRIRSEIKQFRPHVVYCNGGRALQMAIIAARMTRTPVAVHLHALHAKTYLYLYGATQSDLAIHCSEHVRAVHEQKVRFRRSLAVVNAVEERRFPPVDRLQRPSNDEPVVGFVGSLIHNKGVDILIHAFKLLHDRGVKCRLRLAGHNHDGQYPDLARDLRVPAEFVGEVKRENVADFFAGIDVHVLPSRMDAFGLTIVEAAYSGVPTIAPRVGGIPEAMMHGRLGMLYDENTPEQLADRIESMLRSDWLSYQKSAEIARLSRSTFSLAASTQRLCDSLDSLLVSKSAAAPEVAIGQHTRAREPVHNG